MLFTVTNFFAQEESVSTSLSKFEVSFDALRFSSGNRLEFSFDRLLNESESIGVNLSYRSGYIEQGFNYKHFFSKKYAQGFYMQLGLSNYFYKDYSNYYMTDTNIKTAYSLYFDFNMGYKIISKRNFTLDFYSGCSLPIIGGYIDENAPYRKSKYNFGIRIGKRF